MINYRIQDLVPSEKENCCATCKHMFVPLDFLLGSDPEAFCNFNKDRTISGDILTEPFNYYDKDELSAQEDAWNKWAALNKVEFAGICDSYERVI